MRKILGSFLLVLLTMPVQGLPLIQWKKGALYLGDREVLKGRALYPISDSSGFLYVLKEGSSLWTFDGKQWEKNGLELERLTPFGPIVLGIQKDRVFTLFRGRIQDITSFAGELRYLDATGIVVGKEVDRCLLVPGRRVKGIRSFRIVCKKGPSVDPKGLLKGMGTRCFQNPQLLFAAFVREVSWGMVVGIGLLYDNGILKGLLGVRLKDGRTLWWSKKGFVPSGGHGCPTFLSFGALRHAILRGVGDNGLVVRDRLYDSTLKEKGRALGFGGPEHLEYAFLGLPQTSYWRELSRKKVVFRPTCSNDRLLLESNGYKVDLGPCPETIEACGNVLYLSYNDVLYALDLPYMMLYPLDHQGRLSSMECGATGIKVTWDSEGRPLEVVYAGLARNMSGWRVPGRFRPGVIRVSANLVIGLPWTVRLKGVTCKISGETGRAGSYYYALRFPLFRSEFEGKLLIVPLGEPSGSVEVGRGEREGVEGVVSWKDVLRTILHSEFPQGGSDLECIQNVLRWSEYYHSSPGYDQGNILFLKKDRRGLYISKYEGYSTENYIEARLWVDFDRERWSLTIQDLMKDRLISRLQGGFKESLEGGRALKIECTNPDDVVKCRMVKKRLEGPVKPPVIECSKGACFYVSPVVRPRAFEEILSIGELTL